MSALGALIGWRKGARFTQEHTADAIGISRKTFGSMERGRWGFPQCERMQAAETFSRLDAQLGASYAAAEPR
jgi:hypothetical protein